SLSFLVGQWKSEFTRKSPAGKEEKVVSTVRTGWRLQGQFLEMEETQSADGKTPTTTLLLVTFDPDRKAYQGYIFTSSYPNFPMAVLGQATVDKLVLKVDAETSPVMATFTYEKLPSGRYRGSSSLRVGEKDMTEAAEYEPQKKEK
ncbi:MAG TPA: DUF1579 family protein, partial [Fimbriimonas sp.]